MGSGGELAEAFAHLAEELTTKRAHLNGQACRPVAMKQALGRWRADFAGYAQHDAHELLSALLDGLHEDLNLRRTTKAAAKAVTATATKDEALGCDAKDCDDAPAVPRRALEPLHARLEASEHLLVARAAAEPECEHVPVSNPTKLSSKKRASLDDEEGSETREDDRDSVLDFDSGCGRALASPAARDCTARSTPTEGESQQSLLYGPWEARDARDAAASELVCDEDGDVAVERREAIVFSCDDEACLDTTSAKRGRSSMSSSGRQGERRVTESVAEVSRTESESPASCDDEEESGVCGADEEKGCCGTGGLLAEDSADATRRSLSSSHQASCEEQHSRRASREQPCSKIEELLGGRFVSELRCPLCRAVSSTRESFMRVGSASFPHAAHTLVLNFCARESECVDTTFGCERATCIYISRELRDTRAVSLLAAAALRDTLCVSMMAKYHRRLCETLCFCVTFKN